MKISDLPECYQKQVKEKLESEKLRNRNSSATSDKKRIIKYESLETQTTTRFDRQVDISVYTTRRRETDHNAVEAKYVIDSLVTCGVLRNDTKKDVAKLEVFEPIIGTNETTVIRIVEV